MTTGRRGAQGPAAALGSARSLLFVPGARPDRFGKAAASGADVVILDLEDAVPPGDKDEARESVAAWVGAGNTGVVRINAAGTPWFQQDVEAVRHLGCPVMLPKADDATSVEGLARELGNAAAVVPLIETAAGMLNAPEIAAVPGVVRLAFGSLDLAAQLGIAPEDREALLHSRSRLVLAAACAGIPGPVDGVTTVVNDPEATRSDATHALRLGFTGKLCIHPRQVDVVNETFTPTPELLQWAAGVVAAAGDGAARLVDGTMVDKPVLDRARRLLEADSPSGAS